MPIRSADDPAEQPRSDGPSRRPLYGISVAAELSGFAVGVLRLYEQHGFVAPTRTDGGTRRYSDFDIARLRRVAELIGDGVNLVGIGQILALEQRTADLTHDNNRLTARNDQLAAANTRLSSAWRNASEVGQRGRPEHGRNIGQAGTDRRLGPSFERSGARVGGKEAPNGRRRDEHEMARNDSQPQLKDEKMYEELRDKGDSKEKAARISNAAANRGRKNVGKSGGKSPSYEDWTVDDLKKRAKERVWKAVRN